MLAKVLSAAVVGLSAIPIEVEVDIAAQGLPSFTIVGLPDKAVEEAKERVRSAIRNSGATFPAKRITVNLAPADIPKEGPSYDLPIAIGILLASGQLTADISKTLIVGEVSLEGKVRTVTGILPRVLMAKERKIQEVFIPSENGNEASIIDGLSLYKTDSLSSLFLHLSGQTLIPPLLHTPITTFLSNASFEYDMADIKGQEQARRAIEVAAAGFHNILLKGPPGAGKTLLAKTLPSILPQLTLDEALEITRIHSVSSSFEKDSFAIQRPFRSPHHTTSHVGLIGGGTFPQPGEISLAHRGVLFLDEFPEFPRYVLEALRQPLEDGTVTISRSQGKVHFPANFMLVAALNPCPCGYYGDPTHQCNCTASQIARYKKKVSGPLLDRIDIHLDVPAVHVNHLVRDVEKAESSSVIRDRVQTARKRQEKRFKNTSLHTNSEMTSKDTNIFCPLDSESLSLLQLAAVKMGLSARSFFKVIKIARTIADLELKNSIAPSHIAEALQYRPRIETMHP